MLSLDFEGFGMVILKALTCGCPVASTPYSSDPFEVLEDGSWGHLTALDDVEPLTAAIERRGAVTEKGRSHADQFSIVGTAAEYLDLLEGLPRSAPPVT